MKVITTHTGNTAVTAGGVGLFEKGVFYLLGQIGLIFAMLFAILQANIILEKCQVGFRLPYSVALPAGSILFVLTVTLYWVVQIIKDTSE